MEKLSENNLSCLESYQFKNEDLSKDRKNRTENEYLLCVKSADYWSTKHLDKVRRVDVTIWEVVKSFFGMGKLAGCDLRLTSIAKFLEKHDLTSVSTDSAAYQTIHGIAARMLTYKKEGLMIPALWEKLATEAQKITIDRCREGHYNFKSPSYRINSSRDRFLFLTPLTKFGHLRAQVDILENKRASLATTYGGCMKPDYWPWYDTISDTQKVTEASLKGVFFRIIDSISHDYSIPTYHHCEYSC